MVDDPVYDVMKESGLEFAKQILGLLDQFTDIRPDSRRRPTLDR
jgi:hypothetical protein